MARDYIKIDKLATPPPLQATLLLSYISALRTAYELGVRTKAIMDHNTDGTSFADIEALFGLPAAKGQTLYNLVAGSVGAIAGTTQDAGGKTLTEQVGG